MIPKKPALGHLTRGREPVSRLREALATNFVWLDASAGEARSEKIMLHETSQSGMTIRRIVIPL
jgi:hypothetical protein